MIKKTIKFKKLLESTKNPIKQQERFENILGLLYSNYKSGKINKSLFENFLKRAIDYRRRQVEELLIKSNLKYLENPNDLTNYERYRILFKIRKNLPPSFSELLTKLNNIDNIIKNTHNPVVSQKLNITRNQILKDIDLLTNKTLKEYNKNRLNKIKETLKHRYTNLKNKNY